VMPYFDTECPYCGEGVNIDHDDGYGYEEDGTFEQECNKCYRTFNFSTSISYHYETEIILCLYEREHKFISKPENLYPDGKICSVCEIEELGKVDEVKWEAFLANIRPGGKRK